jgi:uncharacterized protein (DUF58 family)
MTRSQAPKLATYAALCAAALTGAIAFSQPGLVALAAPFGAALVVGLLLAHGGEPHISAACTVDMERVLEGGDVELTLELISPRDFGRVDVGLAVPRSLKVVSGEPLVAVGLRGGEPALISCTLKAERWGTFALGPLAVRVRDPGGFYVWQGALGGAVTLQVRPSREHVRTLARRQKVGAASGDQTSRERAEGIEFADIRAFVPGDRPGRVNWRVTARQGRLHVNDYHPERSTDIVLFIDTFAEAGLERTIRIASVLAQAYLAHRDRVGIVGFGGVLSWIEPSGGQLQVERIVDALTATDAFVSFAWKTVDSIPTRMLPARCLLIAISPLLDERAVTAIASIRARGLDVAVIEVPVVIPEYFGETASGKLALRLFAMNRQMMRDRFGSRGVAVATFDDERGVEAALAEITAYRRLARVRAGR